MSVIAVVLGLAVSVAAWASGTGGSSAAAAAQVDLPKKTIGVMGPVNAAEVIKLGTDAVVASAKALGWKTIQVDPQGDPAKMAAGMTSLVNSNVDAIVLVVIEPAVVRSGLLAAKRAGIPVIVTNALVQSSPLFAGQYWPIPKVEFAVLEKRMVRDLPRGSEIGTINLPQFLNAKMAGDLMKQAARRRGWKIVANHDTDVQNPVADTQRAVGDILRANPGIDAIWSCCDFGPTGALPALRSAGKTEIKVYSLHGIPSSIAQAKSGQAVLEVADSQKGGILAVDELADFFATGNPIAKRTPKGGMFKMTIVQQANANQGYPYPTRKVLAPYLKKWKQLYSLPAR